MTRINAKVIPTKEWDKEKGKIKEATIKEIYTTPFGKIYEYLIETDKGIELFVFPNEVKIIN